MDLDYCLDILTRVSLPFAIGAVVMTAVNVVMLEILKISFPTTSFSTLRICIHPILAAIQEPITSKLLPALVIVWFAKNQGQTEDVHARRYHYGLVGGLSVGIVEWGSKVIDSLSLSLTGVLPILMHTVNGLIIGAAVFWVAGKKTHQEKYLILLLAVMLAIAIHLVWNIFIAFWLADLEPCLTF